MVTDEQAEAAVEWVRNNAQALAVAQSQLGAVESYAKIILAELRLESNAPTEGAKNDYAYSHERWAEHQKAVEAASETYNRLRYLTEAAKLRFEVWRTQCANRRIGP